MKKKLTELKMRLKIANSRGRKPVVRDIGKARNLLAGVISETNPCQGRDALKKVNDILWQLLCEND